MLLTQSLSLMVPLVSSASVFRGHVPRANDTASKPEAVDCNNISTGISATCYDTLNLTAYLTDWNTSYSLELCSPEQSFENCLLNYVYTNGTRTTFNSQNITRNDCSSLTSDSGSPLGNKKCPQPMINQKNWTSLEFYTALTIYNVHAHLSIWSQALAAPQSSKGIQNVLAGSTEPFDAGLLLQSILEQYGLDKEADTALGKLVSRHTVRPIAVGTGNLGPAAGVAVAGGKSLPSEGAVQKAVEQFNQRLGVALQLVMNDLGAFMALVEGGAYSELNMATEADLVKSLAGE